MKQLDLFSWQPDPPKEGTPQNACEWKIVSIRKTSTNGLPRCDCAELAVDYWRQHVSAATYFNPDVECLVALVLNTKNFIRGHYLISIGSLNQTIAEVRECYRTAIVASAFGLIIGHNHPSGDPSPSSADQRMTREMAEAGKLLRIELIDHIIVGDPGYFSFREAGML
jgi:DNA repair protein RadC